MYRLLTIAGMTVVVLIAVALTGDRPGPAAAEAVGASCPLTSLEEKDAVLAFEEMMPVVRHPRCTNCHGGVNPLVPYAQGRHMGGFIDTTQIPNSSVQTIRHKCQECHSELEGWDTPGEPMHWVGKSTKEICMQFKRLSHDPADFIGHITDEHGGVQFIETAFKGEKALNDMAKDIPMDDFGIPFRVDPPPGSQEDLIAQGTRWANLIGPRGWNDAACGCEVRTNAWVGSVTASYSRDDEAFGRLREEATATVWLELDTVLSRGVPEEYWKTTAGKITWRSTASGGACTGSSSGTLPVGIGGDDNPMAIVQFRTPGNLNVYNVAIGPWKDQYYKVVKYQCRDGNELISNTPHAVSYWWNHPPNAELRNRMSLEGSYQTVDLAGGKAIWTWSFQRLMP